MKHTYHNERATSIIMLLPYDDGVWLISSVWTHKVHRGKGYATLLLQEVCTEADREDVSLVLSVDSDYDLTFEGPLNKKLEEWYKKFGFIVNKEHVGIHTFMTRLKPQHESLIRRMFSS